MDLLFEKTNVDINSMLISWGLMPGEYYNGVIKTNKFGLFNMWFAFILFLYQLIKWLILMCCPENSQVAIYLVEWTQYFGPKLIVDFIVVVEAVDCIIFILLFYYSLNNSKKMLFWIDFMEFDAEIRCFHKLRLIESESKRFTKQFALM